MFLWLRVLIANEHLKRIFKDVLVEIGYEPSYFSHGESPWTRAQGVNGAYNDLTGRFGANRTRYTINIHSQQEGANKPTMVYIHTFDKAMYRYLQNRVIEHLKNTQKPKGSIQILDIPSDIVNNP